MNTSSNINLRCTIVRLYGIYAKIAAYVFHALRPHKRYTLPTINKPHREEYSSSGEIPKIVWQTNFSEKVTLPVWLNYKLNVYLADGFEFRYVSTEERKEYIKRHYPERIHNAYSRLTDGAAQADLWRVAVLYREGGVYMDIDGSLVCNLRKTLKGKNQLFIASHANRATNFFLATTPGNPIFKDTLDAIVNNIENYREGDVFSVTGPRALRAAMEKHGEIEVLPRSMVCLTGVMTNEHFQYLDRPRSKWCYKKSFLTASATDSKETK